MAGQYVRKLRAQNALMQKAIAVERPGSQSGTLDLSSLKVHAQNRGYMYIAPALHVDDDGFGRAKTFRCKTVDRMPRCSWTHTCYTPDCHVLEFGLIHSSFTQCRATRDASGAGFAASPLESPAPQACISQQFNPREGSGVMRPVGGAQWRRTARKKLWLPAPLACAATQSPFKLRSRREGHSCVSSLACVTL